MSTYAFMQGYLGGNGDSENAGQQAAAEAIKQPESATSNDKAPAAVASESQEFSAQTTTVQKPETPQRKRAKSKKRKIKFSTSDYLRMANLLLV